MPNYFLGFICKNFILFYGILYSSFLAYAYCFLLVGMCIFIFLRLNVRICYICQLRMNSSSYGLHSLKASSWPEFVYFMDLVILFNLFMD